MDMYCMRCKAKKFAGEKAPIEEIKTKKGVKKLVKGICPDCGTKMCKFIK